jgi:hypothetical protein
MRRHEDGARNSCALTFYRGSTEPDVGLALAAPQDYRGTQEIAVYDDSACSVSGSSRSAQSALLILSGMALVGLAFWRRWRQLMRRYFCAVLLTAGLVGIVPRSVQAKQLAIELRHTPILVRPNNTPSLCPMLALQLPQHFWAGAGYELVQDYDAIYWTSELEGHKPIVMSGVRAGAWYRGGPAQHGMSWSAGGLLTLATPSWSLVRSPEGLGDDVNGLDGHTTIIDFGADLTLGYVWERFRLEAFATPAWSIGVVRSPAIWKEEDYSAFTYRFGVSLAILVGL